MKKMFILQKIYKRNIKLTDKSRFNYNLVYCQAVVLEPIKCQLDMLSIDWVQDLLLLLYFNHT